MNNSYLANIIHSSIFISRCILVWTCDEWTSSLCIWKRPKNSLDRSSSYFLDFPFTLRNCEKNQRKSLTITNRSLRSPRQKIPQDHQARKCNKSTLFIGRIQASSIQRRKPDSLGSDPSTGSSSLLFSRDFFVVSIFTLSIDRSIELCHLVSRCTVKIIKCIVCNLVTVIDSSSKERTRIFEKTSPIFHVFRRFFFIFSMKNVKVVFFT